MRSLLAALALVAVACGGTTGSADDVTNHEATATTSVGVGQEPTPDATATATVSADPDEPTATATTSDAVREKPDGNPAPDFVLALGEGGEFSPSSEDKPIYMVFWAEW